MNVGKLKGTSNAILLTFHSSFLPDYVRIAHISLHVKKFRMRPTQCHSCYEYGHVKDKCENQARCFVCSGSHDLSEACTKDKFCFHCNGGHSPNWKNCSFYKFETDALEIASNEHVTIGAAKYMLRLSSNPLSTYASAAKSQQSVPASSKNTPTQVADTTNASAAKSQQSVPASLKNNPTQEVDTTDFNLKSNQVDSSSPVESVEKVVHQAVVHQVDSSSPVESVEKVAQHPPNSKANSKPVNPSVKSKTRLNTSFDSFQSPPKSKKGRLSSPPKFALETNNRFQVLDQPALASTSHLSQSCSDLTHMESDDKIQNKDKKETVSNPPPSTSGIPAPSKVEIKNKADEKNLKIDFSKKGQLPHFNKETDSNGSKLKRLSYSFKSFNSNNHSKSQSRKDLTGRKK